MFHTDGGREEERKERRRTQRGRRECMKTSNTGANEKSATKWG